MSCRELAKVEFATDPIKRPKSDLRPTRYIFYVDEAAQTPAIYETTPTRQRKIREIKSITAFRPSVSAAARNAASIKLQKAMDCGIGNASISFASAMEVPYTAHGNKYASTKKTINGCCFTLFILKSREIFRGGIINEPAENSRI